MQSHGSYMRMFTPYALAAFLIGLVGGFSTVLGPAFVRDLGIGYENTTWTALAQAISTAACAPILGRLGDALGRKITLLLGIAIFTLGNAMTAIAPGLGAMLVARFIVGLGTAAIAPVVMAYIVTEFPPERVAQGFSLYMLISSASVIFGPTLGGMLIAARGWRVMAWLCAALSACVFLACIVSGRQERSVAKGMGAFDWAGAVWVIVFFSLALCIPSFGQNFGWGSRIFGITGIGAACALLGLVWTEKRAKQPILPKNVIFRRVFLLSIGALFLTQGLMQANMTGTIIFVSHIQPDNTLLSSYAISVMYLGMSLGAVLLGPLADRWEPRNVLCICLALTALGCGTMLLFSPGTGAGLLMASLGILGFGLGGNGTIFMKVALSGVPPEAAGAGTGTYGLFRDLAAPFGVAVYVPMFTNQITARMASGIGESSAAVGAIHFLAAVEIGAVAAGIGLTLCLPKIYQGGKSHEIGK